MEFPLLVKKGLCVCVCVDRQTDRSIDLPGIPLIPVFGNLKSRGREMKSLKQWDPVSKEQQQSSPKSGSSSKKQMSSCSSPQFLLIAEVWVGGALPTEHLPSPRPRLPHPEESLDSVYSLPGTSVNKQMEGNQRTLLKSFATSQSCRSESLERGRQEAW